MNGKKEERMHTNTSKKLALQCLNGALYFVVLEI